MSNKKTSVLIRWFDEVWNNGNKEAISEMLDPEAVTHGIAGEDSKGHEAFMIFYDGFRSEFPQIRIKVEETVSEGDIEVVRCVVDAVHKDENKVNFTGMCMARIVNGKIKEGWNNFDFLTMYQQLGQTLS